VFNDVWLIKYVKMVKYIVIYGVWLVK